MPGGGKYGEDVRTSLSQLPRLARLVSCQGWHLPSNGPFLRSAHGTKLFDILRERFPFLRRVDGFRSRKSESEGLDQDRSPASWAHAAHEAANADRALATRARARRLEGWSLASPLVSEARHRTAKYLFSKLTFCWRSPNEAGTPAGRSRWSRAAALRLAAAALLRITGTALPRRAAACAAQVFEGPPSHPGRTHVSDA